MSKSDNEIRSWVERIIDGDKDAFKMLYLKFYGPLCRFAWQLLRSSHLSEELVQDAFLNLWEDRSILNKDKNVKSFLYKNVKNKALNHLKRQGIIDQFNQESIWLNDQFCTQVHDFNEKDKFIDAVKKAIENLPEGVRKIYKLYRKDGLTYQEISEFLEITPKTVESQLAIALKQLRKDLVIYKQLEE